MKTKFERQYEAKERKLATLPKRRARLIAAVLNHHEDTTNSWTFKRLKEEVEGFHAFLREIDQVWGNDSFMVFRNRVVLTGENPNVMSAPDRQCIYCRARLGEAHVTPCVAGTDVEHYNAIYKDKS